MESKVSSFGKLLNLEIAQKLIALKNILTGLFIWLLSNMFSSPRKIWNAIRNYIKPYVKHLSKPQKRHFQTYLMGMIIPSEKRRKSVSAINELVGSRDQSSLNRFLHGGPNNILESTRNEDSIGNLSSHRFALVIDDTLVDHPYAEKMEGVSSFYDATKRRYIQGHQLVTAILVDIKTNEIHPVNLSAYLKIEHFLNGCKCKKCKEIPIRGTQLGRKSCKCKECRATEFQTKIQIAKEIFLGIRQRFQIEYVVMDSWYASKELLETIGKLPYVTELKWNRWVWEANESDGEHIIIPEFPKCHAGKRYQKRARQNGWKKIKDIAEDALKNGKFTPGNDDLINDSQVSYTYQYQIKLGLIDGNVLNVLILHDPKTGDIKSLCSNNMFFKSEDFIRLMRIRWRIEEFHKDVKDLGLGEYQLRELRAVLIHGHIALVAYSLLKALLEDSVRLFGMALSTIGECSRAVKEMLFYQRHIKKYWLM
jgi:hypothetical protein